jgi:ribose 5-phosphate isomerase A
VGEEKLVTHLGEHGHLPVEVLSFAAGFSIRMIAALGLKASIRAGDDGPEFVTDNGNLVLDCRVREIRNPARLERDLRAIPGVVGTGLFVGMADVVLVASRGAKIRTLRRAH